MLLDTSGLLSLLHKAEPFHHKACECYRTAHIRLTHNYVLAEFIALATVRRFPRLAALEFVADLQKTPAIDVVWINEPLHSKAMALLLKREDKTYSLCDAVSFCLCATGASMTH